MTSIQLLPLLSYVLISSFTPGPANITSNSLGMRFGLRRTLGFQAGLAAGVLLLMALAGLVSASLLSQFPALEPVLRDVGAAYILYLAVVILHASYHTSGAAGETKPMGFGHGLLLQISNPKLMVYALTVFATFLAPIAGNVVTIGLAAALLAAVSACATITWALFGAQISARLPNPRFALWLNIGLALFLAYAALDLLFWQPTGK